MLFNSWEFVILVLATMLLYYLPPFRPAQVILLIIASFIFYGSHEPILLLLLTFSVCINALTSWKVRQSTVAIARVWAIVGVVVNLAILGFFKYAGLLASTFQWESGIADTLYAIPLPIGISFFTFQGISLVIDVFSERQEGENTIVNQSGMQHFVSTVFYISFFSQLVAGPIVKAKQFLPQIKAKAFGDIDWEYCFRKLVLGYFFKMVVADNLKDWTYFIEYPYFLSLSSIDLLMMLFGYSMQIFADFAGYSLIALGIAGLFGYRLPTNFEFPYIASSFSEFWRRWHISLSSWLRDYLYLPLGGNRKGVARTYFNLFIVMFLGGLWHGAAWSYATWGTLHGCALAIERAFRSRLSIPDYGLIVWLKRLGVFLFVTFAWLFFKIPNFEHSILFFESIGKNLNIAPKQTALFYVSIFSFPVVACHLYYLWKNEALKRDLEPAIFGTMLFALLFNSGTPGAFIYFQF